MKEDIYYVYINGEGKVKKFLPTTKLSERRKIFNLLNNDNINKIKINLSDKKFLFANIYLLLFFHPTKTTFSCNITEFMCIQTIFTS